MENKSLTGSINVKFESEIEVDLFEEITPMVEIGKKIVFNFLTNGGYLEVYKWKKKKERFGKLQNNF